MYETDTPYVQSIQYRSREHISSSDSRHVRDVSNKPLLRTFQHISKRGHAAPHNQSCLFALWSSTLLAKSKCLSTLQSSNLFLTCLCLRVLHARTFNSPSQQKKTLVKEMSFSGVPRIRRATTLVSSEAGKARHREALAQGLKSNLPF